MYETILDQNILIDDTESVLITIQNLSGQPVRDMGAIKKFIQTECYTRFYVTSRLSSTTREDPGATYLWLDSGYTTRSGKPILISLLQGRKGYIGHTVGTVQSLCESARCFFSLKKKDTEHKAEAFMRKYKDRSSRRTHPHIEDEKAYLLGFDEAPSETELGRILSAFSLPDAEEKPAQLTEPAPQPEELSLPPQQEEMTIALLLDIIEELQQKLDGALTALKTNEQERGARIKELEKINEEYRRIVLQIRCFEERQDAMLQTRVKEGEALLGHDLLRGRGRILIVGGSELGVDVMQALARDCYGFEKRDLHFIPYDKFKNEADRIRTDGQTRAIIWGESPHSARGNGGAASALAKFMAMENAPFIADARCRSGKLKVTKTSFREALRDVVRDLCGAA